MSCLGYVSLGFVLYRICLEGDKGASLSPPRLKKNKKRKEQMTNIKNASPNNVFVLVMGGGIRWILSWKPRIPNTYQIGTTCLWFQNHFLEDTNFCDFLWKCVKWFAKNPPGNGMDGKNTPAPKIPRQIKKRILHAYDSRNFNCTEMQEIMQFANIFSQP